MLKIVFLVLGAAITAGGWFWWRNEKKTALREERKAKKMPMLVFLIGVWFFLGMFATVLFPGVEKREFEVELFAARVQVGPFQVSSTVVISWIIIAVIFVLCLLFRLLVVPKFTDVPHGIQNVVELAVEYADQYTNSTGGGAGEGLPSYIFALCLYMLGSAAVELFGLRAPTSDIMVTISMALITFFLIQFYGLKKLGVVGRLKNISCGNPVVAPFKAASDIAIPVSLACRLFGNMMAGMIIMDLLYSFMGAFSFGLPSLLGLYFNLFHPCIQIFVFVTLSLTFIREATE